MRTQDMKRSELLDDLLAAEGRDSIPKEADVLNLICREKRRRSRRRHLIAMVSAGILLLVALRGGDRPPGVPETGSSLVSTAFSPESIPESRKAAVLEINHIGDHELMELLDGRPAALVHYPNGSRRLMLVVAAP